MMKCFTCSEKIGRYDDNLSCNGKCGNSFHIKCLEISVEDFIKLKESSSFKLWKCVDCNSNITSNMSEQTDSQILNLPPNLGTQITEIIHNGIKSAMATIIPEIIKQFKNEIENLKSQNVILRKEVAKLSSTKATYSTVLQSGESPRNPANLEVMNNIPYRPDTSKGAIPKPRQNQDTKFETTKSKAESTEKVNTKSEQSKIQNSQKQNENADTKEGFIFPRKSRKRNIIRGTDKKTTGIKVADRYAHFHVFGLHTDTSPQELTDYLTCKGITSVTCLKVISKRPEEYSSFKVSVNYNDREKITDPGNWPEGVGINPFLARLMRPQRSLSPK